MKAHLSWRQKFSDRLQHHPLFLFRLAIALPLILVGAGGFLGWTSEDQNSENEPAVELLIEEEYLKRLLREIKSAKSKIWVVMYVASYNPKHSYGVQQEIVKALSKKYQQGLDVRVLLDASYEWDQRKGRPSDKLSTKNDDMMKALKKEGIPVKFDGLKRILHGKWVLLDEDRSILGSHNWTYSALKKNIEASVFLRSAEHHKELADVFSSIWDSHPQQ